MSLNDLLALFYLSFYSQYTTLQSPSTPEPKELKRPPSLPLMVNTLSLCFSLWTGPSESPEAAEEVEHDL